LIYIRVQIIFQLSQSYVYAHSSCSFQFIDFEKKNTESLNIHLKIHFTANCSLNDKAAIDDRVTKITYVLQKVIEKSTSWTKSSNCAKNFWNQSCSEIMMKLR
jgi:hypothetical protein